MALNHRAMAKNQNDHFVVIDVEDEMLRYFAPDRAVDYQKKGPREIRSEGSFVPENLSHHNGSHVW